MWPLAILTGDCINAFFFYKEMYGRFAGPKKGAVITRWLYHWGGRKAGFHSIVNLFQIWSTPAGYEELAVGFEPIKSREIFVTVKDKTNTN